MTTLNVAGTFGLNEWYITNPTVTLSAEDRPVDGSADVKTIEFRLDNGASWQTYSAPFILPDGAHHLQYRAIDRVDNVETAKSVVIKVDTVAPVVSTWTDAPTYTRVDPFVVHYAGYDPEPGSGLVSLTGEFLGQPVSNEQVVDLFWLDLGPYTVSVAGEDYAGWQSQASASIALVATLESMQATVARLCEEGFIDNGGVCKSLTQKLGTAARPEIVGSGRPCSTC